MQRHIAIYLFCQSDGTRHAVDNAVIRIGILEDDVDFGDYLRRTIDADAGLELTFLAHSVSDALTAFDAHTPDLILVDMQLPDGSGLDLVSKAAQTASCKIMLLTVLADRKSVLAAFEGGAHGYLLKDTPAEQIRRNIHSVMDGQSPVSPAAATHILALFQRDPVAAGDVQNQPTAREREILQMISKGLSYAETATAVGISIHTVGDHIKSIYRKLAVNSKSEAIFEGRQKGWIKRFD
jgi:DNA-binding NarL/FixJ family response regulator